MSMISQLHSGLSKLVGLSLLCGTPLGVLVAFIGFIVVGMGHGWGMPLGLSIFAPLLCSLALFRLFGANRSLSAQQDVAGTFIICAVFILPLFFWAVMDTGIDESLAAFFAALVFGLLAYAGVHKASGGSLWGAIFGDILLLGIGLWTDVLLYQSAVSDEAFGYRGDAFEHTWLALWAVWQVVALVALVRRLRISV